MTAKINILQIRWQILLTRSALYWRLMRFDKPIGILLLWYPTALALWAANHGMPPLKLLLLFFLGTCLMRAAGCVINDIADRNFDVFVARTTKRPLTCGLISLTEALFLVLVLLLGAVSILVNLPKDCIYFALAATLITAIYPFCKRFLKAPQLVLGLAFSMGIPMAYTASLACLDKQAVLLFLSNFLWIIAYDTEYAMADKLDDQRLNLQSTARWFGNYARIIIGLLQASAHLGFFVWAHTCHMSLVFYGFWVQALLVLIYQQILLAKDSPQHYSQAFLSNAQYGLCLWLGIIFSSH